MSAAVLTGDCLALMPAMEPDSIDAIVSDPPYGLAFMGKAWDHGVPGPAFWREALRVAKPGAHLVAFGGTRTYHRLTCAIEDAGWEIRDCLMWLYGSGFPKSLDVSKAMDKARHDRAEVCAVTAWVRATRDAKGLSNATIDSALGYNGMAGHWTTGNAQPAVPTLAQWPLLLGVLGVEARDVPDHVAHLVEYLNSRKGQPGAAWYTRETLATRPGRGATRGIYNDFTADDYTVTAPTTDAARQWDGWGTALKPAWEPIILARKPLAGTVAANVLLHGTGALNIDGCRLSAVGNTTKAHRLPGERSREHYRTGTAAGTVPTDAGRWPANLALDEEAAAMLDEASGYGDTGGASRFFYTAKASRRERDAGLEGHARRVVNEDTPPGGTPGSNSPRAGAGRHGAVANHHPTVKPIALMRWLVRLVTPPGGVVLDPFTGSGSTGCAAVYEGRPFVGCELSEEYATIARARIAHAEAQVAQAQPTLGLDEEAACAHATAERSSEPAPAVPPNGPPRLHVVPGACSAAGTSSRARWPRPGRNGSACLTRTMTPRASHARAWPKGPLACYSTPCADTLPTAPAYPAPSSRSPDAPRATHRRIVGYGGPVPGPCCSPPSDSP